MAEKKLAKCAVSEGVISLADNLRILSDVNRLRIMCLLFGGEKCVCEIEESLGISQPLASHHLRILLEAGLVEVRREGTWSYYSLERASIEALNRRFEEFLGSGRLEAPGPSRHNEAPCGAKICKVDQALARPSAKAKRRVRT